MQGRGAEDDLVFEFVGGDLVRYGTSIGLETSVPIAGDFGPTAGSEILFTVPGAGDSDIGLSSDLSPLDTFGDLEGPDGFFDYATGNFVASAAGDELLWFSEADASWLLNRRNGSQLWTEVGLDASACDIPEGRWLNPIVGNFDDDAEEEILWHIVDEGGGVLWASVAPCSSTEVELPAFAKLHPGDFDGDGDTEVLTESEDGSVSLFDGGSATSVAASAPRDSLALVGDFNGDGCSDVLWHQGTTGSGELWRSLCNGVFEEETITTPEGLEPIGYLYGHGRPYRAN